MTTKQTDTAKRDADQRARDDAATKAKPGAAKDPDQHNSGDKSSRTKPEPEPKTLAEKLRVAQTAATALNPPANLDKRLAIGSAVRVQHETGKPFNLPDVFAQVSQENSPHESTRGDGSDMTLPVPKGEGKGNQDLDPNAPKVLDEAGNRIPQPKGGAEPAAGKR